MTVVTYSQLRQRLAAVMDQVCDSASPVIVTRQNARSVVMLSLEEYESMEETLHLLRSPRNAERLVRSIARRRRQIDRGRASRVKLLWASDAWEDYLCGSTLILRAREDQSPARRDPPTAIQGAGQARTAQGQPRRLVVTPHHWGAQIGLSGSRQR